MIVSINEEDLQKIKNYIGNDRTYCLYLYTNLLKYGLKNPNQKIWIDKSEFGIQCVFLLYYDCLHVYTSNHNYELNQIDEIIIKENPKTIFSPSYLDLNGLDVVSRNYHTDEMTIFKKSDCIVDTKYDIRAATIQDIPAIVRLLLSDNEFSKIYSEEKLAQQLKERISNGYSRMCILKDNDRVVATISTNAEIDTIAIIGGLVVDASQRGKGYGTALMKYLQHELITEGNDAFSIVTSKTSKEINLKLNSKIVAVVNKYYSIQ